VQGLTEVLPVSSSAHLALLPGLLGWEQPADRTTFAAALHAGSCAGLLWALRADLTALTGQEVVLVGLTSVPAALAGVLAADAVEARLGRPLPTAALLAAGGAGLALADRRPSAVGIGPRAAGWAALAQVVALAPGVSRSGAALTALRALQVRRTDAARFSLLMSLPVTAGAALLTLLRADRRLVAAALPALLTGVPAAAVTAAVAVTVGLRRAPDRTLAASALYRLGFAAAVAAHSRKGPR
jgi:undecaprenyl-diphosphatase